MDSEFVSPSEGDDDIFSDCGELLAKYGFEGYDPSNLDCDPGHFPDGKEAYLRQEFGGINGVRSVLGLVLMDESVLEADSA